ncbi:hypothetical protein [Burkholderia sp. BCC1972]|uniref:O-linked N-acetylglucosamine transferase family protein n=1 Tax=Burkholderia sp. BCC1972 TaxID=2817438 RepID=UPI0039F1BB47
MDEKGPGCFRPVICIAALNPRAQSCDLGSHRVCISALAEQGSLEPRSRGAGRYGASHLAAIGLRELITPAIEAYEAMAVDVARLPGMLGAIREKLRASRDQSVLFDTDQFVRHLEQAYRGALQRYDRALPPAATDVVQVRRATSDAHSRGRRLKPGLQSLKCNKM